jgi:hypothetical protein
MKNINMNSQHAGNMNSTFVSHGSLEHLLTMCFVSALTIISFMPNLGVAQSATPASTQSTPAADVDTGNESSGVIHAEAPSTGPLVIKYPFKKHNGHADLMCYPDGKWLFSVQDTDKMQGKDLEIALALQSRDGGVYVFHFAADASNGVEKSKEGTSGILKDAFNTFSAHNYAVELRFPETTKGKAKLYEEQEKKKETLRKEEKEAKERHDEKLAAEKKAELEKEEKTQREDAQRAAQQSQAQSSGGGSGGGIMSTIGNVLGTVAGPLLSLL